MSHASEGVLASIFRVLALAGLLTACGDLEEGSDPALPDGATLEEEGSVGSVGVDSGGGEFRAVYAFEGRYDSETRRLEFSEPVFEQLEESGVRTTAQAAWCFRDSVAFSVNQNPVAAFRLSSTPVLQGTACFGGTYPGGGIVQQLYQSSGALCADVTVRNFFGTVQQSVYAQLDQLIPTSGYTPFAAGIPGATTSVTPPNAVLIGSDLLPNASRGLWFYGNLGPIGSTDPLLRPEATVPWIFANAGQPDLLRFRGRLVADLQEDCTSSVDDNCNGRVNEGCGQYGLLAACSTSSDCQSDNCQGGLCQTSLCFNGLKNGSESDVDCGGGCLAKCALGRTCVQSLDCSSNACQDGVCVATLRPFAAGQIVISEFMANPVGVPDSDGEWIELQNAASIPLDLRGCTLTDTDNDPVVGERHTITGSVRIEPNQLGVIGSSTDSNLNGGLTNVRYGYGLTYQLDNSDDEIELRCNGLLVDRLTYTSTFPGASTQVSSDALTAIGNDLPASICRSTSQTADYSELGSPGSGNQVCELTNVSCRTVLPATNLAAQGNTNVAGEVAVLVPGLTDESTGGNGSAGLRVEAALVPSGSDPQLHSGWTRASLFGGYSASSPNAGSDRYGSSLRLPSSIGSVVNLVFRARGGEAAAWTYCDRDGSANGYLPAQAPAITTTSTSARPVANQIRITELLIDGNASGTGGYERNEFIEFLNVTGSTLDLNGCTFDENPGTADVVISSSLQVGPGQYIVLSNHAQRQFTPAPGVLDIDTRSTGFDLGNGSGNNIILTCAGVQVVRLDFSGPTPGLSRQTPGSVITGPQQGLAGMCNITNTGTENILSTTTVAPNHDFGTPGSLNGQCTPLNPPSRCYLLNTNPTQVYRTVPSRHNVRFVIPGLTDPPFNNVDSRVRVQVGYGPTTTSPVVNPAAFAWTNGTADGYTGSTEDNYYADFAVPNAGPYGVAARVSVDGGSTWSMYCDNVNDAIFETSSMRPLTILPSPATQSCSVTGGLNDPVPLSPFLPFQARTFEVRGQVTGFTDVNVNAHDNNGNVAVEGAVSITGVPATQDSVFNGRWVGAGTRVSGDNGADVWRGILIMPDVTARTIQASYRIRVPNAGVLFYCNPNGVFGPFNAGALEASTLAAFSVDPALSSHLPFPEGDSIVSGQSVTADFVLTVPGLTDRLTNVATGLVATEVNSTVRVRHQLVDSSTSAVVATATPAFDSSVPINDLYHSFRITLAPAAGSYISRFQVSVNGGTTWNAFESTRTLTVGTTVPPATPPGYGGPSTVWINEVRYDVAGTDTAEFVELAGPAGLPLAGWQILGVDGGNEFAAGAFSPTALIPLPTSLSGARGSGGVGYASVTYATEQLRNGARKGFMLIDPVGNVVQLISFEGQFTMAPNQGAGRRLLRSVTTAAVQQGNATLDPLRSSLQLRGNGCRYEDFTWERTTVDTQGRVNAAQTFNCPSATTLGRPCTADSQCQQNQWCSSVLNYRYCAPRVFAGAAEQMDFAYIPSGVYLQGTDGDTSDEVAFTSLLSRNFFASRTEVTQRQWLAATTSVNPSCFQSTTVDSCSSVNSNLSGPVEQVDWFSALAYANWLSTQAGLTPCYTISPASCADTVSDWRDGVASGCTGATFQGLACSGYRLLTETEWERAARAATSTLYHWGDTTTSTTVAQFAWFAFNTSVRTRPVQGKTANGFGLFDTAGNVWEWVWDGYVYEYPVVRATDYTGSTSESFRVIRGGAWTSGTSDLRTARRETQLARVAENTVGFRLARTAP